VSRSAMRGVWLRWLAVLVSALLAAVGFNKCVELVDEPLSER